MKLTSPFLRVQERHILTLVLITYAAYLFDSGQRLGVTTHVINLFGNGFITLWQWWLIVSIWWLMANKVKPRGLVIGILPQATYTFFAIWWYISNPNFPIAGFANHALVTIMCTYLVAKRLQGIHNGHPDDTD